MRDDSDPRGCRPTETVESRLEYLESKVAFLEKREIAFTEGLRQVRDVVLPATADRKRVVTVANPSVTDIVKTYLQTHGYDGLYNDDCGCTLDDLAPCGEMNHQDCKAGYLCACGVCMGPVKGEECDGACKE